jgi:uncharacterized protein with PIN domain
VTIVETSALFAIVVGEIAKNRGLPLFKGDDFSQIDILPAWRP